MQGMSDGWRGRVRVTMGEQGDHAGCARFLGRAAAPDRAAAQRRGRRIARRSRSMSRGGLLERCRDEIRAGNGAVPGAAELAARASAELRARERRRLVPVINATGVVLHTNLGRAPLPLDALDALEAVGSGYSNLEYDVEAGARGSRQAHVEGLLRELTGAEAALVVNNNAAAVLLAVAALAGGREVVVSRGQLVEIGGSFRIPEILAASGARLVEVGTTNRTRIADYERAIGPDTAALMRVHPSNFRTVGFTEEPSLRELTELAARRGLAVIDDIGSGVLSRDAGPAGRAARRTSPRPRTASPPAPTSCASRATSCSAGRRPASRSARPPRSSACGRIRSRGRCGSTSSRWRRWRRRCACTAIRARAAAEVPVLEMLAADEQELLERAVRIHDGIAADAPAGSTVRIVRAAGRAGGGSLPLLELEGPVVAVEAGAGAHALSERLRRGDPAIVARVHEGAVLLDPRTMSDVEVEFLVRGVQAALRAPA